MRRMPWSRGEPLTIAHRSRLLAAGAHAEIVDDLRLRAITGPLPDWWHSGGNVLYLRDGMTVPRAIVDRMAMFPFSGALVVLAIGLEALTCLLLGGDDACVFIGPDSYLSAGEVYCGGGSSIVLNSGVVGTSRPQIDARNGGTIVTEPEQLWAAGVYIATDDMHRLEEVATGMRINPFGAHIRLGRHVWLGRDAIVTGHVEIGDGAVVGMRSLVRNQKVPAATAVAGTPARVIREGVTWSPDDHP